MPVKSNRRALLMGLVGVASVAVMELGTGLEPQLARADAAKPAIGTWGLDLAAMDRSVVPGDDFFRYTGGTWMKTTKIPADRRAGAPSTFSSPSRRRRSRRHRSRGEHIARAGLGRTQGRRLLPQLCRCRRNRSTRSRSGQGGSRAHRQTRNARRVARLVASPEFRANSPVGIGVGSTPSALTCTSSARPVGPRNARSRLLSEDGRQVRGHAREISRLHRNDVETRRDRRRGRFRRRDRGLRNENRRAALAARKVAQSRSHLQPEIARRTQSFAPEFPWAMGSDRSAPPAQDFFVVAQMDAVRGLAKLFRETPVATWRAYLTFHYLTAWRMFCRRFDDAAFDFNGRTVTGQPTQRDRWKRAVTAMSGGFRRADGRGGGPALRRAQLHAGGEGRDGEAGREPALGVQRAHRQAIVDD